MVLHCVSRYREADKSDVSGFALKHIVIVLVFPGAIHSSKRGNPFSANDNLLSPIIEA